MASDVEDIEDKLMKELDELSEPLSNSEYLELCENLASNCQSRADAVREEIGDDEDA